PTATCSSAALAAGSAAGTGYRAWPGGNARVAGVAGVAGQLPATRTAWPAMPAIDAASRIGVFAFPALAGGAGSAPGTSPSGSDQEAWEKPSGTPASAVPISG